MHGLRRRLDILNPVTKVGLDHRRHFRIITGLTTPSEKRRMLLAMQENNSLTGVVPYDLKAVIINHVTFAKLFLQHGSVSEIFFS